MFRRALVAGCLLATPLRAQNPEDRSAAELRSLVARLDAQVATQASARMRAESASASTRTARLVTAGDVALILSRVVPDSTGFAMARRADSILAAAGVVPPAFTRSLVFVMPDASDTALALTAADMAPRRRIAIHVPEIRPDGATDDWWVLGPLVTAFTMSLDSTWQAWGQNAWAFVRWPPSEAPERGGRELTMPRFAAGEACLAGRPIGCRRYLGLDDDLRPYAVRFTPAERREFAGNMHGSFPGVATCRNGDDGACLALLERYPFTGLGGIPSSADTRAGLLAAVAAMHGPAAVRAALADRQGSVGERLSRAAGVGVDSLVLEWRAWALSGGRPHHVQAGIGDLAAALVAVSILTFLATRSRRWD